MEKRFKPIGDRIVVQPLEGDKLESGLELPDNLAAPPTQGRVVAIGQGLNGNPMQCAVGDLVVFDRFGGTRMTLHDVEYVVIRETELFTIID